MFTQMTAEGRHQEENQRWLMQPALEHLLETLRARVPAMVDALALQQRHVPHGLLSVGIKLHCLEDEGLFDPLIDALG